ncbi:MAG: HAMP domain-containing protein [Gammaproteobacteria bacterium]|nr:HAMP domain-containing protein [Gammaproteobacteria bacterium]
MFKRFYSLQTALLLHELSFILLVLITVSAGGVWSVFWQQNSAESLRIGSMNTTVQNVRGELYRQLKEVFDASFLHDNDAIDEYQSYTGTITQELKTLNSLSSDEQEQRAIRDVSKAYRDFYEQTVVLFRSESLGVEQQQLLDHDLEQETFAQLELAFTTLEQLLTSKQQLLTDSRARWSKTLIWLALVPLLIAISLLLVARRFVRGNVVRPLSDVIDGAKLISKGDLDHDIPLVGVTELVKLSEAINTMASDLVSSRDRLVETKKQAAMGDLVPLVAHNIRNPLAGIRAASQVAIDDEIPGHTKDTLSDIIVAVDRLERWVTSLLSYLHPMKPHLSATTLKDIADNALLLIELQLVDKSITLKRLGWEGAAKTVQLDGHLFEQAVFNLAQNALEASKAGDVITLQYKQSDDALSLTIIDQGLGLIFDPLSEQPLNGDVKRLSCGLGIPFAQKIIKQHGGTLTYRKGSNGGTAVEIKLMLPS